MRQRFPPKAQWGPNHCHGNKDPDGVQRTEIDEWAMMNIEVLADADN